MKFWVAYLVIRHAPKECALWRFTAVLLLTMFDEVFPPVWKQQIGQDGVVSLTPHFVNNDYVTAEIIYST